MWYIIVFLILLVTIGPDHPFLIALALGILYLFRSGKKRRAKAILPCIYALAERGEKFAILDSLYFDAALKFALEHGAQLDPGVKAPYANIATFYMHIQGTKYIVTVSRLPSGGTLLGVEDADELQRAFVARLNRGSN